MIHCQNSWNTFHSSRSLYTDYDDSDASFPPDEDEDSTFHTYSNGTIKWNSYQFESPLDKFIPPTTMLDEEASETHPPQISQDPCFLEAEQDSFISNKKPSAKESDGDSFHTQRPQTDVDWKSAEPSEGKNSKNRKDRQAIKRKNQYDKNITANICSTVIRKIVNASSLKEVKFYCKHYNVSPKQFLQFFRSFIRKNARFGTSQLVNFFQKHKEDGFGSVFGLLMTRFLDEQYLLYILRVGKMDNKHKYLECASNLLYIPRQQPQEYHLIALFHQMDRAI